VQSAVLALRGGATDYFTRPLDACRLQSFIERISGVRRRRPTPALCADDLEKGILRGLSAPMLAVYELVLKAAPTEATVVLYGESGTGKEVLAGALHRLSRRADAPFVAVNCGAVSAPLAESMLFGHERGSFTGAERLHRGIFEQASEGTLFLDEITEMPNELQVKLLRVLETGSLTRVGGEAPVRFGGRVICATNRPPEEAVRCGRLRADLWYRLSVFPIAVPPLRQRPGDIRLLAQHFLDELNAAHETAVRWQASALRALEDHWWPGNVRELKNTVYRSYILATDHEVRIIDLAPDIARAADAPRVQPSAQATPGALHVPLGSSVAAVERRLILATLAHCKGNKQSAANVLGVSLKTLYNRLDRYRRGPDGAHELDS
jgi:DNA-binding NtrC family response regulator